MKRFKSIGLYTSSLDSEKIFIARQIEEILGSKGCKVLYANTFKTPKTKKEIKTYSDKYLSSNCDLLIAIGGDGTMLSCSRLFGIQRIPILGINLGTLGFLTDIAPDELTTKLQEVINGKYTLDKRFFLETQIKSSKNKKKHIALNEVVIHSGAIAQLIEYDLYIDDIFVFMLHNRLIGISLRNLSVQWEFESASKIDSRLVAHNNLVSFIRYGEHAELLSLDIVTGEIVNKVSLKIPVSVPVIYQGRLFLMMNNTLVCLDSVSKRQYWKKRLSLDFEVLPIVSAGKLIVATDLGKIVALDIDTGKLHWTYQSGVLLQRGLVAFGDIIIWVQLLDSGEMVLNALNTNTGNLNWQSSLGMTSVSHLPLVDKQQVYIFGEVLDQNSVLNVFDLDKGSLNFNVLIGDVLPSHRPVLLSGLIVFIADNQYWLLDQFTGDFFKSKVYKYQLLDHYFYKQWVVQWQKQGDRYKLSFNM